MRDEGSIEPNKAVAVVKIGKRKPVREGEISHRESGIHAAGSSIPPVSIFGYANLNRESYSRDSVGHRRCADTTKIGLEGPQIKGRPGLPRPACGERVGVRGCCQLFIVGKPLTLPLARPLPLLALAGREGLSPRGRCWA